MFHSIRKPHYAWIICLCGLWLFVTNMGLCSNILSVYLPFIEGTGLSDSMGSAILSIRCLSSFAATFVVERYYRRLGLRRGIFIASLFGVASALVYSIGGSAFVYYTGAVLGGICYGLGAIYPSALMLTRSLQTTFLLQAGFMLISAACVFLLLRDDPAQKGLSPYGEGGASSVKAREQEGPAQLPALVMWMLALMMLLIGGAGQAFSGHLSVLARSCGYTVRAAATVVSLQGMVLVCSKLLSGGVADRFGPRRCTTLLIAIFLLGCAAVQFMNGVSLFWCFVPPCLMGFGASVYNVGPPLWAGDLSDKAGYPKLLKWLQIFYNLGGILFSAVPGIIADHTGEYKSSYILIAGMMLVSLLILLWSYRRVLGDRSDA